MGYSNKFRAPKYLKLEANQRPGYPVRVNRKNSVPEGFGPRIFRNDILPPAEEPRMARVLNHDASGETAEYLSIAIV